MIKQFDVCYSCRKIEEFTRVNSIDYFYNSPTSGWCSYYRTPERSLLFCSNECYASFLLKNEILERIKAFFTYKPKFITDICVSCGRSGKSNIVYGGSRFYPGFEPKDIIDGWFADGICSRACYSKYITSKES